MRVQYMGKNRKVSKLADYAQMRKTRSRNLAEEPRFIHPMKLPNSGMAPIPYRIQIRIGPTWRLKKLPSRIGQVNYTFGW